MSSKNTPDLSGNMKDIPLIYIHYGAIPNYLIKSIDSAAVFNKRIILLTDSDFKHSKVTCFPISKYNKDIDVFNSVYNHLSTNSIEFEKICITRWFVLQNFLNAEGIEVCYYSDSDVMIYDDLSKVYDNYSEYDAAYTLSESQENYRWAASACCSYWKAQALNNFCDFILSCYTTEKKALLEEKWAFHQKNNIAGGICDMTLLYLFSRDINFYSLSKVKNHLAFDGNMRDSSNYYKDEYEMEQGSNKGQFLKKIEWKDGRPYGFNRKLGEKVRFIALTEYAKILDEKKTVFKRVGNKIKSLIR